MDGDHWPDLYVANDAGANNLFRNDGGGKFTDVSAGSGVCPPEFPARSIAVLDYDGDGLCDVFLTGGGYFAGKDHKEIRGHPCKLYKNLGNWKFKDVTAEIGLDLLADGQPWFYTHGCAVSDYDRDGWPDLLVYLSTT